MLSVGQGDWAWQVSKKKWEKEIGAGNRPRNSRGAGMGEKMGQIFEAMVRWVTWRYRVIGALEDRKERWDRSDGAFTWRPGDG